MADPSAVAASLGKVAVLFGGRSAEREISLRSGSMVLAALNRQGVRAYAFDPAERSLTDLVSGGFDRAFIALHGRFGEDGTIQGALEILGIPYTGAGVQASAVAMDKLLTKKIWQASDLPTPESVELGPLTDLSAVFERLGAPCIVKPVSEGSTLGLSKVARAADMAQAFALASRFDQRVMAERFISGREITVAILGDGEQARALPAIEIRAPNGNYDYQNKYFTDDTQYLCPAPLPEALRRELERLSVQAYLALNASGWGRVDIMLDADERPWLLELNTAPGMTDHSLVPMAGRADGLSYDELVLQITASARLQTRADGEVRR